MPDWKIVNGNLPFKDEFAERATDFDGYPDSLWIIHNDGYLPTKRMFATRAAIDDAPDSLWRIHNDGYLPIKVTFATRAKIDDGPDSLWKIVDGELPFKTMFPKRYKPVREKYLPPSSFTFKDINSSEFGHLEALPLCLKHEERTDFINFVSGSPLVRETSALKSKVVTMTLGLNDISPGNIDKINSWLIGTGKLIFSNDPNRYYIATCNNALTGQRILTLGKLPVQFNVMPYKYDNSESDVWEDITIAEGLISKTVNVGYNGNAPSESAYKITGTGNIEIYNVHNGRSVEIHDVSGYCIVDIKKKKVYDHNNNVILDHTYGDIFDLQLNQGNNFFFLSMNVTKLEVKKRTRWY